NMAYGEDSWLNTDNGRDMQWNPDSVVFRPNASSIGAATLFGVTSVFGGKHYIYVLGHNNNGQYSIPMYDGDRVADSLFVNGVPASIYKGKVLGDIMWAGIPMLVQGHSILETDVTVRLRVAKPYDTGYGAPINGNSWRNNTPDNNNYPMYSFNTSGLAVETDNATAASNALRLINVVPNPYYAYSPYESDRLDTRVRITNLPPVCTISIFALNGTLITVINKNSPITYTDWTLKNQYGVPIASGMYLINVNVPNVGQRNLKWFGVMRPVDLNSY
ncbi:MAG TPA: T9SS C-terminal target domain-containing protein, partial [Bacteroidia bacterium]|nr:T9SS C-terminal target domain-containing protein [Bacteroidia bacterium]